MSLQSFSGKCFWAMLFALLFSWNVFAQSPMCPCSDLHSDSGHPPDILIFRKGETKPFTGYCCSIDPKTADTLIIMYYRNGKEIMYKHFGKDHRLTDYYIVYGRPKNDSICNESFRFGQFDGDTIFYFVTYVNAKNEKWWLLKSYYENGKQASLKSVMSYRYIPFDLAEPILQLEKEKFWQKDSLGFSSLSLRSGHAVSYYPSGIIAQEGNYGGYEYFIRNKKNPSTDSLRIGEWKYFYANGKLKRVENYDEDGKMLDKIVYDTSEVIGKTKKGNEINFPIVPGMSLSPNVNYYITVLSKYDNGNVSRETIDDLNGTIYTYGFYQNGKPYSIDAYHKFIPIGIHKTWDEQGRVITFRNYSVSENDTVSFTSYNGKFRFINLKNNSAKLELTEQDVDNVWGIDGCQLKTLNLHRDYYADGKPKEEVHFENGLREGGYKKWYANGTIATEANYFHDTLDGNFKEWYSNGKLKKDAHYTMGMRDGIFIEYYANGNVKWKNNYDKGKPGIPEAYSEDGKRIVKKNLNYLNAFYPDSSIQDKSKYLAMEAYEYFLLDSVAEKSQQEIILPDTFFSFYTNRMISINLSRDSGFIFSHFSNSLGPDAYFDPFHGAITIAQNIYSDSLTKKIKTFFGKNNITIDSIIFDDGAYSFSGKSYIFYFSSGHAINNLVLKNKLTALFTSGNRSSWYFGSNYKTGKMKSNGSDIYDHTIKKLNGRTLIKFYNDYCVYDDLTCDPLNNPYNCYHWFGDFISLGRQPE